ncbi:DNA-binding NarL/FixJ family response regulator [Leucobacter exalbidus]|uniref:DNA-binding NarL/FixJ family response regulator n=1 Tax=Leucobacter exalbidus TaxID=662960 RepID=A0A940PUT2_9MICO|nr:response regulator transcription factor [Leucobacter exalbidus]MBP1326615.1 DNA-binding NarL/FixJ family response regulator [Leucobacter exalbidus]
MTTSVMLIDDHPVVRSGLRAVLEQHGGITVVGEAGTGEAGVELARAVRPDVVLCDLRLGSGIDGIETTRQLCALPEPPAVLILTTFDRDAELIGAVEAGAAGYLLKDVAPEAIIAGIEQAAAGGLYLPGELAARVLDVMRRPRPQLTQREIEVLTLAATGAANREIARDLFVSEATVKSHLSHIFGKLGVDSRSRAIRVAGDAGLI